MKKFVSIGAALLLCVTGFAQDDYFSKRRKEFSSFVEKKQSEYAEFMKASWEKFRAVGVVVPRGEEKPLPPKEYEMEEKRYENRAIDFEEIVPILEEDAAPVPVRPKPELARKPVERLELAFYDRACSFDVVRDRPHLSGCSEDSVAEMWQRMADCYGSVLEGAFRYRKELALCDWAYLELCRSLAGRIYSDVDEATVLEAYILNQSGFKIRLARDDKDRLHYLIATNRVLYHYPYFVLDGSRFFLLEKGFDELYVFNRVYPNEEPLRLDIRENMQLPLKNERACTVSSKRYPEASVQLTVNGNIMDFYSGYPSSIRENEPITKWQVYARKPLDEGVRRSFQSALSPVFEGKTELEAVEVLLNLVQTGFTYGSDYEIWGGDRAFFAEETLYYPYSDCEDRSILFSSLVRELLGLDVVLVYYPNHLATAVRFSSNVPGDYLEMDGKRYVICDPTYVNAPVGVTMSGVDNSKAKVIII